MSSMKAMFSYRGFRSAWFVSPPKKLTLLRQPLPYHYPRIISYFQYFIGQAGSTCHVPANSCESICNEECVRWFVLYCYKNSVYTSVGSREGSVRSRLTVFILVGYPQLLLNENWKIWKWKIIPLILFFSIVLNFMSAWLPPIVCTVYCAMCILHLKKKKKKTKRTWCLPGAARFERAFLIAERSSSLQGLTIILLYSTTSRTWKTLIIWTWYIDT